MLKSFKSNYNLYIKGNKKILKYKILLCISIVTYIIIANILYLPISKNILNSYGIYKNVLVTCNVLAILMWPLLTGLSCAFIVIIILGDLFLQKNNWQVSKYVI